MATRVVSLAPFIGSAGAAQAGHLFAHQHLERLAQNSDVTAVSTPLWGNAAALERSGRRYRVVLTDEHPVGSRLRQVKRLVGDPDHTIRPPALTGEVAELVRAADVVELQWSQSLGLAARVAELNPRAVLSAVEHDVVFTQLAGNLQQASEPKRTAMRAQLVRQRLRERSLLRRVDVVTVFRQDDADALRAMLPATTQVVVHSPWLEPTQALGPAEAQSVLFVGAFNRPENTEAVRWFVEQVWPTVLAAHPQAVFTAAGAGMPSELAASLNAQGVETTGYVDSLEPYYEAARGVVAPLQRGGGLKFKVAQAMTAALPVVGTPEAFAGFVLGELTHLRQASPAGMAAQVNELLGDLALARRTGVRCQELAQAQFSFESSHQALLRAWDDARARRAA